MTKTRVARNVAILVTVCLFLVALQVTLRHLIGPWSLLFTVPLGLFLGWNSDALWRMR